MLQVQLREQQGVPVTCGNIGQQQDLGVAVLGGLVQQHPHLPQFHLPWVTGLSRAAAAAVHLHHPHTPFLDFPGSRATNRDEVVQGLGVYRGGVLPYQEAGSALAQLEEPPGNAEVAVSDPEVPWMPSSSISSSRRTLLSVGVLARHGVDDQSEVEVVNHQGLTGEHGFLDIAGLWDSVLSTRQVIAVEDLDAVARKRDGAIGFELPHHLGERFAVVWTKARQTRARFP